MSVAIVLCGGAGRRMGGDKHLLPWGDSTLVESVLARVGEVCEEVIVVAAVDQRLPPLNTHVRVVRDRNPDRGPLEGLIVGLATLPTLPSPAPRAFVTGCDTPRLVPGVVRYLLQRAEESSAELVLPVDGSRLFPLCAVYSAGLVSALESLCGRTSRLREISDVARTERIPVDELRVWDKELASLINLNTQVAYQVALEAWKCENG